MTPAQLAQDIKEINYPIAEVFDSIQGEGRWAGTMMRFIRMAGCNVGQVRNRETNNLLNFRGAPASFLASPEASAHTACRIWDGKYMLCDTDYRTSNKRNVQSLLDGLACIEHICITGGEPFLHDLSPLIFAAQSKDLMVHIETSGTKTALLHGMIDRNKLWITWSPKHQADMEFSSICNEVKILIYPDTNEKLLDDWFYHYESLGGDMNFVYLQPITNRINQPDSMGYQKCIDLMTRDPRLKLSLQLHKYLEVR